jgi:hypothetical protein
LVNGGRLDIQLQAGSTIWLRGYGAANQPFVVQGSTNLHDWLNLTNLVTDGSGLFQFKERARTSLFGFFYRLRSP